MNDVNHWIDNRIGNVWSRENGTRMDGVEINCEGVVECSFLENALIAKGKIYI